MNSNLSGKEVTQKRKSHLPKASANIIRFCEILDSLPINFIFKLSNVSKNFNGSWEKKIFDGATAWHSGPRILFNSSFFHKRNQVLEAIEREGLPVRKLYSADTKAKTRILTKEKVQELYYKQKKSLEDIAKEYGYSRNWIMLLMEKYGLKRRTRSEALKEAIRQNKVASRRI